MTRQGVKARQRFTLSAIHSYNEVRLNLPRGIHEGGRPVQFQPGPAKRYHDVMAHTRLRRAPPPGSPRLLRWVYAWGTAAFMSAPTIAAIRGSAPLSRSAGLRHHEMLSFPMPGGWLNTLTVIAVVSPLPFAATLAIAWAAVLTRSVPSAKA
jgi:hypothetical protein